MPATSVPFHIVKRLALAPRVWRVALAAIWLAAAAAGLWMLWRYDNTPGEAARAPEQWPALATMARASDRPTLVMLAHPHCTCTRASLGELAETIARARTSPRTYVLFMAPARFEKDWEKTDLWQTAAALPGATVVRDDDGRMAQQFGAVTSGQVLLYDAGGALIFSGGITGARAHAGDNVGRQSLVALLNREPAIQRGSKVFGCSLFDRGI
ncbi:MAG TPA: hypothetical protein VH740_28250 [Vicinamibacterales bacterium]|jgi:hypothetical protein